MRLKTAGHPIGFSRSIVGIVAHRLDGGDNALNSIFVAEQVPDILPDVCALITKEDVGDRRFGFPVVSRTREIDHLQDGDIVAIDAASGFIRTLFRPLSGHNFLFATERCNSNCLMCSQPPKDQNDSDALTVRNLEVIKLISKPPEYLTITGGEPTLLGHRLFTILRALRDSMPDTHVHILSNGRSFAWPEFVDGLVASGHPRLSLGIPLYSDNAAIHDFVVQAKGAFDQTMIGLHQLARWGQSIEIRVVLHRQTVERLPQLAEYIYRNLTFVEHIALMGLEHIGYTPRNLGLLWVDPIAYQEKLREAVFVLRLRGMNVSVYNHPLCVLPEVLWKFSKQSISDWKNIYCEACSTCDVRDQCGGLFSWSGNIQHTSIHPIRLTDRCTPA